MKTNDKHESVSRITGRGLVLVSLLAVALALAASSFAQSSAASAPKIVDAKAAQPAQAAADSLTAHATRAPRGSGEGIQLHGWWTIEIRNRDGSVAKHVEFENGLVEAGPSILAGLLSGNLVGGAWSLAVNANPSPCSSSNGLGGGACFIVEAGTGLALTYGTCTATVGPVASGTQPFCYATLVPSLTGAANSSFGYSSFTLSGQFYADTSTTLTSVESSTLPCGPSTATISASTFSPSSCLTAAGYYGYFTQYLFYFESCGGTGQPLCAISVQAGQVVAASVTFTFSSPSESATPALAHPRPLLRAPNPAKPPASAPVTR
jgi:hypothetical protein